MGKNLASWRVHARFATVVLIIVLAWVALHPDLQPSHAAILSANFLLGTLAALGFSRRVAIAIALPLFGAIFPELLQAFVPIRDTRVVEIMVKWLVTILGICGGLLFMFLFDQSARQDKDMPDR
jgi:membrane associated rhomboid family serine protease